MTSTRGTGPHNHAQAGPTNVRRQTTDAARRAEAPWWGDSTEALDWWTSPTLAYWRGLNDGVQLERERQAAADDIAHRSTVRHLVRFVDVVDHRERVDRGEVA